LRRRGIGAILLTAFKVIPAPVATAIGPTKLDNSVPIV
jgi:hypothetical protein